MELSHREVGRESYTEPELRGVGGRAFGPELPEPVVGSVGRDEGEGEGVGRGEREAGNDLDYERVSSAKKSLILHTTSISVSKAGKTVLMFTGVSTDSK